MYFKFWCLFFYVIKGVLAYSFNKQTLMALGRKKLNLFEDRADKCLCACYCDGQNYLKF